MFKHSASINPDVDSSDTNSEDDADKYSKDESDDENPPRSFVNPSYNERQLNSCKVNTNYSATGSNGHSNNSTKETNHWHPSFGVTNSYYQSKLSSKKKQPLKINIGKVPKVKIRKPSVGIPRSRNNSSSPFSISFLKKRSKLVQGNPVRKRSVPKSRPKNLLLSRSRGNNVNGLSGAQSADAVNAEAPVNDVPRLPAPQLPPPSVPALYPWPNSSKEVAGGVSDDGETNVGEYAQYLELKPSVKFKCYRCGTNDFSTMASLQGHIATCNGPVRNDSVNHSSPVRTMKPLAAAPAASPNLRITRKVFLCSSCGTYYQNYNLYIHMRDKHNKQICLFCRNIFSRSEQLWDHLVATHKLNSVAYTNASQIRNAFKSSFYITCCSCNSIFSDDEPFNEHDCNIDHRLVATADTALCTDCKPNVILTDTKECNASSADADTLANSPRRESLSSMENEEESRAEFHDTFMSRDSTLNFIGVPEDHTITSLLDETNDIAEEKSEIVSETIDKPVPDVSPVPESGHDEADDNANDNSSSVGDGNDRRESSPSLHVVENYSTDDPVLPDMRETDMRETSTSLLEQPSADEKSGEYNVAPVYDDTAPVADADGAPVADENEARPADEDTLPVADEKSSTTEEEDEIITKEPLEAEGSGSLAEIDEPVDHADTNVADAEDIEQHKETPPPATPPVETTPLPLPMALMLDEAVDSLSVQTLIKECVRTSFLSCLYCTNATLIAVSGANLVAHLLAEHRFMPTKHEDDSQKVIQKLESGANDLTGVYMNAFFSTHREITFDGTFACLQCSFTTSLFKDLCHHKRRSHHKIIFLCIMCKCNFQFYSQLLCHLCPGSYSSESLFTLKYHCCFCDVDLIPSAFRLMVHLRKVHQACDICLSQHSNQSELYTHMIKQHKINHLCYKCNLAWRSRDDINKHLFWKHGTESVLCKRCLQKKWPHAYHFCIPASSYTCNECSRIFSKAVALTVHRRAHNGEFPFECDLCEQRCISKKLLAAHKEIVHHIMREPQPTSTISNETIVEQSTENQSSHVSADRTSNSNEESNDCGGGGSTSFSKKKRKKTKSNNEKPLLDELPPLNLSSESDEETADEEAAKTDALQLPLTTETAVAEAAPSTLLPPSGCNQLLTDESQMDHVSDSATATSMDEERQEVSAILNELAIAAVAAAAASPSAISAPPMDWESTTAKLPKTPPSQQTEEEVSAEQAHFIEKMLNCLIIEHSYCIPDSIFHSSDMTNQSALSEGSDNNTTSGSKQQHSKRDKSSCSKSVTPRKHKHLPKRESSSSDSSSDTDSSSSSCGSNCSCNKSGASNCSSSSSSESTTPEKQTTASTKKKQQRSPSQEKLSANTTNDSTPAREQSLLSVPESDLDTEVTVSDEDFYEEHPFHVPPPPVPTAPESVATPVVSTTASVQSLPYENKITISRDTGSVLVSPLRSECKSNTKKRKKKPKITINLGGMRRNANAPKLSLVHGIASTDTSANQTSSSFGLYSSTPNVTAGSMSYHESTSVVAYSNCVSSTTDSLVVAASSTTPIMLHKPSPSGNSTDASGRLSKRKRVKNKFYGYSSSDDNSGHESLKTTIQLKKRPPSKKPKSRPAFVGIRAKRPANFLMRPSLHFQQQLQQRSPAIPSSTGAYHGSVSEAYRVSAATPTSHLYRQPQYIQQQRNFVKPVVPDSSDDSDSDEKRHKLVINLPNSKEKLFNNRLSYGFSSVPTPADGGGSATGRGGGAAGAGGDSSAGKGSWFMQRPSQKVQLQQSQLLQQQPQLPSAAQSTPTKKEIYCFCRCPYDEVSEMIGCDAPNCPIEWFHFECVGIMAAPQGQWFCPNCRKNPENISRSF